MHSINLKPSILLFLVLTYFLFPKLNLISITNFNLRVQDYISVLILIFIIPEILINRKTLFLFLIFFSIQFLIGFFYNELLGLVFVTRLIQYILIGYSIFLIINSDFRKVFFYLLFTFIVLSSILQYLLLIPNFDPGRGLIYSRQFSGPFSTSAELSYFMISVLFFFFSIGLVARSLFAILIFSNGVIFAPLIYFSISLKRIILLIPRTIIILLPYLFLIALAAYFIDYEILLSRITDPQYEDNTQLQKGKSLNLINVEGPLSFLFRINKFLDILVYMTSNPLIFFLGCGYGCGMGAVDSGIVRILLEFGIFVPLFLMYSKIIPKYFLACFLGVNLLFDGFWSSQVAPMLFAAVFYIYKLRIESLRHK